MKISSISKKFTFLKRKGSALGVGLGVLVADQVVASVRSWSEDKEDVSLDTVKASQLKDADLVSATDEIIVSEALLALDEQVEAELALVSGVPHGLMLGSLPVDAEVSEVVDTTDAFDRFAEVDGAAQDHSLAGAEISRSVDMDLSEPVSAELKKAAGDSSAQATATTAVAPVSALGDLYTLAIFGGVAGVALVVGDSSSTSVATPPEPEKDTVSPSAKIALADKILTAGETTTVTITFSEAVKGFELSDLMAQNGTLTELVQSSSNPLVWTVKFTPASLVEDVTNIVSLSASYTDLTGNAGNAGNSDNYIVATKLAGGTVADGYIDGATVFRDLDGDGVMGPGEDSVITDAAGAFSGLGGYGGSIIAMGGTDISTGLKYEGILKAPAGSAVINPLTTLVSAVMGDTSGKSPDEIASLISAAEAKVTALLGIDPSLGALTQIDPIALVAAGGAGAEAALNMQLAAIQAANVLVTITQSIVNSGVAADANAASELLSGALGSLINSIGAGGSLNLSDASVLDQLFASVADAAKDASQSSLLSLQAISDQASSALASVNASIDAIDASRGVEGLKEAVAAQLVVVGADGLLTSLELSIEDTLDLLASLGLTPDSSAEELANALSQAIGNVNFGDDFSEDKLNDLIHNNLDDVKDVVAPTDAPTDAPTSAPTDAPTSAPTDAPTSAPTDAPTSAPTDAPTSAPTDAPTSAPTDAPTDAPTSAPTDAPTTNPVDTLRPTATITVADDDLKAGETSLVTITFSEAVSGFTNADLTIANGTLTDVASTDGGLTWTATLTPASGAEDTTNVISLGTSYTDAAGNSGTAATSNNYAVDTTTRELTTADDALDSSTDGTVNLNTSLSALAAMGIDTIEAVSGSGVDSVVVDGYGSSTEISGLSFADAVGNDLDVTLQLTAADDALDSSTDGTVNLNTSLSALAAMGIDTIEAVSGSGVDSVVVDGYGSSTEISGLSFADAVGNDLDVTLQLTAADDALDSSTDGTVNLNTSLSALAAMGIDTIEAVSGSGVDSVVVDGYGSSTEISGLSFADAVGNDLDVTLQLTAADDALDSSTDGTVNLNTSLSALAAMGIDTIEAVSGSGVDSVVVDGYGSSTEISGLSFADAVGNDLDVTLQLTAADDALDSSTDGTVNLNTSLSALAAMGIDTIEAVSGSGVDSVVVDGYGSSTEISGLSFADAVGNDLDVTLQLTAADDALDSSTDGTVNLNTSLSALAAMGIDTIEAVSGSGVDSVVVAGGIGGLALVDLDSLFASDLGVTLMLADAESTTMLTTDNLQSLKDMGIDLIVGTDGDSLDLEDWLA